LVVAETVQTPRPPDPKTRRPEDPQTFIPSELKKTS